jgi:hypothetical protein
MATLISRPDHRAISTPVTVPFSQLDFPGGLGYYNVPGCRWIGEELLMYSACSLMIATMQALDAMNESAKARTDARDKRSDSQATARKDAHEHVLGPARNLDPTQERHRTDEQDDVVEYVDPGKDVVEHHAIDAAACYTVVPVLCDRPACDHRGREAEQTVRREVQDESKEEALRCLHFEDPSTLEEGAELDGEVGDSVCDDGRVQGLQEVGEHSVVDPVAQAVPDFCSL